MTIYTTKQCNLYYDQAHKTSIHMQIHEVIPTVLKEGEAYCAECHMNDIDKVCKDLKVRKALGWERVGPEHWKYGGQIVCQLLTVIVNCINRNESVPCHFKHGVIVPIDIPGKDSTYKDNNRCITIGPLIGKIWEKLLIVHFIPWARQQNVIDELQGCSHRDVLVCILVGWLEKQFHTI